MNIVTCFAISAGDTCFASLASHDQTADPDWGLHFAPALAEPVKNIWPGPKHRFCSLLLFFLFSYTRTGIHVGQNFGCVRYSKIAGLSTSLMRHGGLNLVQSCKMWCAVCTLPHSHKSKPHRPISFMLAANRPTPVLRRLSWTQAFLFLIGHEVKVQPVIGLPLIEQLCYFGIMEYIIVIIIPMTPTGFQLRIAQTGVTYSTVALPAA